MTKQPYIGITGFMSKNEIQSLVGPTANPLYESERTLMIGVLASSTTIKGIANKQPNRYPLASDISNIFLGGCNYLNLIHYNTKVPETLLEQLIIVTDLGGPNFGGFQLNIAWPNPEILRRYRKWYAKHTVVLQIGGRAFEMVENSPEKLAEKIKEYARFIDYVLLDPSGGFGQKFDPEMAHRYLEELYEFKSKSGLDINFGIAGGLSPLTLDILKPLIKDFPDISIDAEARLRTKEDHLDIEIAKNYVIGSAKMFAEARVKSP